MERPKSELHWHCARYHPFWLLVVGRIGGTMPNTHDNLREERKHLRENHSRRTMGNGPTGISAQTDNWVNLALIVIVLAIVLVIVLFR